MQKKPAEHQPLVSDANKSDVTKDPNYRLYVAGSIALLVGIGVTKVQLTAQLFSSAGYPTAYSLWSNVVTIVALCPVFLVKPNWFSVPSWEMWPVLSLVIFFTAIDMGLTNIALSELTTTLQTCIASTNPFWALLIESALYRRLQHPLIYIIVALLVTGAIFTAFGTISKISAVGVTCAVLAVISSASKYSFTHNAFKRFQGKLGALALLFWVDLCLIPVFLVWLGLADLAGNHELYNMFDATLHDAALFWQMTGTGLLGGFRAFTQFLVLLFVTATSMSTANITTQVLNTLISIPIQHTPVTTSLVVGITITICSSITYTFLKINKQVLVQLDNALGCAPKE